METYEPDVSIGYGLGPLMPDLLPNPPNPSFGHGLLLSTAVANGLASIGMEYTRSVAICQRERCSQALVSDYRPLIFNGTSEEYHPCKSLDYIDWSNSGVPTELSRDFKDPGEDVRDSQWTEISFPRFRYGYGWGFAPSTVKFAAVILLLHALIVLVHVCYVLVAGLSYDFGDDIAELLALALESKPPEVFNTSKMPKSPDGVWTRSTMVRQAEEDGRLELVVDKGLKNWRGVERDQVDMYEGT